MWGRTFRLCSRVSGVFGQVCMSCRECRSSISRLVTCQTGATRAICTSSRMFETLGKGDFQEPEYKPHTIIQASIEQKASMLQILWDGGKEDFFPFVWLRDNCDCSECQSRGSRNRLLAIRDIPIEIHPRMIKIGRDNKHVDITWPDEHHSSYHIDWLFARRFLPVTQAERARMYHSRRRLWGAENQVEKLPTHNFETIMTDEMALYNWLHELDIYGFALIRSVHPRDGQVASLSKRVAFRRPTHYGYGYQVKNKPNADNATYTTGQLGLHNDLTYYHYIPGVILLHCIAQHEGPGGETILADGFYTAQEMRKIDVNAYRFLRNTKIDHMDRGEEDMGPFYKIAQQPTIEENHIGEIVRINYNNFSRDSYLHVPLDMVQPLYRCLQTFDELLYKNSITFKMKPGDMITIDNTRILHGRVGYETGSVQRHLEGCYLDWDEIYSRIRTLSQPLHPERHPAES